jgi:hypothetical protein
MGRYKDWCDKNQEGQMDILKCSQIAVGSKQCLLSLGS